MPVVKVTINGVTREYEKGTTFEEIAKAYQSEYKYRIAAVIFNGKIRELMKPVKKDGDLSFVTYADSIGFDTMRRTAIMILIKAVRDVLGSGDKAVIKVEFTIGNGYFVILFPQDGHMPQLFVNKPSSVKKIVVKVKI